ncbi:BON domain-containing protein [Paraburkholderia sp. Cy-641]|uniref:BON domain-containing protein n=1 Tax=Paraburkholderia sp. Cy-641 TaxID=2608337 RepID=UPI001422DC91|nr:BON domain-containing protein [Paraburkholderia sp. Cy-641]
MSFRGYLMLLAIVFAQVSLATVHAQPASEPAASVASGDARGLKRADHALAKSVQRALGKTRGIDASRVFVRARSGVVTLTGTVPSAEQIPRVVQVVEGVAGVHAVVNRLVMQSGGQ